MTGRRPEKDWRDELRAGDVITEGGRWRIVRASTYKSDGTLCAVSLAIRRCSWTHRCYTTIMRVDLKQRGFRPVQVPRRRLSARIDRLIRQSIGHVVKRRTDLTCCDVETVA